MHSTHVLSLAWSCISVWVFTSCVVPQDGDTPPLLHIGQLTAGPEHCTGPDESANKQKQKHKPGQQSWAPSPQNKLNIPMLQFLKSAFTDQTTTKKKKNWAYTLSFSWFTWWQDWTLKVNTSCVLYTVWVCVCVHTRLSSKPWPACRLLLMPGTGHYWTSAHSWHKLQCKTQNTTNWLSCQTLADRDNKQNLEGKLMMSQAVHGSWLKDPAEQTPLLNWLLGHQFTDTLQLIDCC